MRKEVFFIFLFGMFLVKELAGQKKTNLSDWLSECNCKASVLLVTHDYNYYNRPVSSKKIPISQFDSKGTVQFMNGIWEMSYSTKLPVDTSNEIDVEFNFKLKECISHQTSISLQFEFDNWDKSNYVLMPGAAYNGNRFESRRIRYSPKLLDSRDIGPNMPIIISDVPRLNVHEGPSRIQERSGSMSVPSIGFQSDSTHTGFFLVTHQGTKYGDTGIGIEESRDRKTAVISLTIPVVRENYQYSITDNQSASKDMAPDFFTGDEFSIGFRLYSFPAQNIQDLFHHFADIRNYLPSEENCKPVIPFSSCFSVQEAKFNEQNWVEKNGYYSVGMRENFLQDWQIGWTGGMISTYPLLFAGGEKSKKNVIRNFDWIFPSGISPSGFFWDSGEKGTKWYGGDIRKPNTVNWHLVRKSGDGLYYVIKQLMLMERKNIPINPEWEKGTKTVSDAFVRLWNKWGQFGNFIDSNTGDVIVGGSTSGAIVSGALVLASKYFKNTVYLEVAKSAGEYYYKNFVIKGITCGGPGDAMQNPDSESAYAMLESFVQLYESTLDRKWLSRAEEMADQFSSWVMPYSFKFPKNSTLGKMGVSTTGTVFANTQNKHSAPGICTYSGIALWRLFRATGNVRYMRLLKDIASVLPQYLSHADNPIEKMKIGWMSERINTTDWLEGIGEIMYGSTWSETSLMLSFIEIPGVYLLKDKPYLCIIDNISGEIIENGVNLVKIRLTNPTKSEANVRIYAENMKQAQIPLGENALYQCTIENLKPGEVKVLEIKK